MTFRTLKDLDDTSDFDQVQMIRLGMSGPLKGMSEQSLRDLVFALAEVISPDKPDAAIAGALMRGG